MYKDEIDDEDMLLQRALDRYTTGLKTPKKDNDKLLQRPLDRCTTGVKTPKKDDEGLDDEDAFLQKALFRSITAVIIQKKDDEQFKVFSSICPVLKFNSKKIFNWTHPVCGNRMEISVNANIRCQRCRKADSILNWKFSCCEKYTVEYKPADPLSTTHALTIIKSQSKGQDKEWYDKLCKNFMRKALQKCQSKRK